jgi:hypothetical protein
MIGYPQALARGFSPKICKKTRRCSELQRRVKDGTARITRSILPEVSTLKRVGCKYAEGHLAGTPGVIGNRAVSGITDELLELQGPH